MPQAVCTRYGLKVGAIMAPLVRVLLILFFPIAYPISKVRDFDPICFLYWSAKSFFFLITKCFLILVQVLDWMLGKGHGVLLRRAELKTFVTFHGNEVAVKTWLLCLFLTATFLIFFIFFLVGWERWRSDNRWDFYHHRCTWIDRKDSKRCNDSHFQRVLPWSWFNS